MILHPTKSAVYVAGNVPRVDGLLAMSWAFGDSTLKEHISSDPDVAAEIIDSEAEFIILGSDGLWKVRCHSLIVLSLRNKLFSWKTKCEK